MNRPRPCGSLPPTATPSARRGGARKALFLDEPVSGLDPQSAEEMYRVIEELNRGGVTVVMVSHDIAPALEYASHVLRVGKSVFFGTKQEYAEREGVGR